MFLKYFDKLKQIVYDEIHKDRVYSNSDYKLIRQGLQLFQDEGIQNGVIEEKSNGKVVLQGDECSKIKDKFDEYELSESSKFLKEQK